MYKILRSILFLIPAESAHYLAMYTFKIFCRIPFVNLFVKFLFSFENNNLFVSQLGLKFKNPIGIAAGFDKDANFIKELDILGFGFVEVGTVTPLPQSGNPKPRLFRLKIDEALINRMGFNNQGADQMVARLKKIKNKEIIIGGNIGKNKITPLNEAHLDYLKCFKKLNPYVDYFVINVSSPNTPGLRSLQDKEPLLKIIHTLLDERKQEELKRPILLKIAPDLTEEQLDDIAEILNTTKLDGLIATNTTIDRSKLKTHKAEIAAIGNGGLSGKPVESKSNDILDAIMSKVKRKITIIGVGGINDGASTLRKLEKGAHLVQIYTGFIYGGPFIVKRIKKFLISHLR